MYYRMRGGQKSVWDANSYKERRNIRKYRCVCRKDKSRKEISCLQKMGGKEWEEVGIGMEYRDEEVTIF